MLKAGPAMRLRDIMKSLDTTESDLGMVLERKLGEAKVRASGGDGGQNL